MRTLTIVLALGFAVLLAPIPISSADPPPEGYDTAYVAAGDFAYVEDYGDMPLRRGFYDADGVNNDSRVPPEDQGGTGFGLDKAEHKHGITNHELMIYVMENGSRTNRGPERPTVLNMRMEVQTSACVGTALPGNIACTRQFGPYTVITAVETREWETYHGWPSGGPDSSLGLLTAYCQGYYPQCPEQINYNEFKEAAQTA